MKLFRYVVLGTCFAALLLAKPVFAEGGHFASYITQVHNSAQLAKEAQTLEDLQAHARKTMAYANEFQRAAQAVNDAGFVSQAVDIYTYAQRAVLSSSLKEAREYIAQAASYARLASDESGITVHDPDARRNYNDPEDVSYRNYYNNNYY
jgi:hypothetical protein